MVFCLQVFCILYEKIFTSIKSLVIFANFVIFHTSLRAFKGVINSINKNFKTINKNQHENFGIIDFFGFRRSN